MRYVDRGVDKLYEWKMRSSVDLTAKNLRLLWSTLRPHLNWKRHLPRQDAQECAGRVFRNIFLTSCSLGIGGIGAKSPPNPYPAGM